MQMSLVRFRGITCERAEIGGSPAQRKLVKVDSEETGGEDGKGANAIDGDSATFLHTHCQDAGPSHPHAGLTFRSCAR